MHLAFKSAPVATISLLLISSKCVEDGHGSFEEAVSRKKYSSARKNEPVLSVLPLTVDDVEGF